MYVQQYVQVWGNKLLSLYNSMYRCRETATVCVQLYVQVWGNSCYLCTTVCTGVGKQLLCTTVCTGVGETAAVCVQLYVQVWGNSCCLCTTVCTGGGKQLLSMYNCMYRCRETATVCVQQYYRCGETAAVCVQQYVQVWGNSCTLCFHPAQGEPQGAAGGMLTDEQI